MNQLLGSLILLSVALTSCSEPEKTDFKPSVIPEPVRMRVQKGTFEINNYTVIVIDSEKENITNIARQLKQAIDSGTASNIDVLKKNTGEPTGNYISLSIDRNRNTVNNDEGYRLNVTPDRVNIRAATSNGLFYGMQTLLQLLPPEIYHTDYTLVPQNTRWEIPSVEITDYPRFPYRGMHLDVGRHLFPVEFIKRYIDLMAMHKMNRFHWHLTEDQGWRIEIKQYPKLTEIGAWRDSTLVGHYETETYDGERYGGYYTQEEIREIVQYARERYITIIPEIEMPGHASAALTAYPELGCVEGKEYKVKTTWGIFNDIYCPSEETFAFLENVLAEVMKLFPSKQIHIGGDEAPKKQWKESQLAQQVIKRENLKGEHELQSYFIRRIEQYINARGRQIIGWDEILEGGLAPNATVMSWRGTEGGVKAAQQGNNVIMTPTSHVYLDYYQGPPDTEPLAIGAFIPLRKVYDFEPVPDELTAEEAPYIRGAQGNVWTEYMHSGDKVEYMAYPRASAIAEVTWSPRSKRNWTDFWRRLQTHFERFEVMNVNAAEHYRGKIPAFDEIK